MTVGCSVTAADSIDTKGDEAICWRRLSKVDELSRLRHEWNAINPEDDCPLRHWQWLENWWRCYANPGRELFTIVVRSRVDERLIAALPLFLERTWLGGRVLRFLGSGEVCTDYNTLIACPTDRDRAAALIAHALAEELDGAFDWIELQSVLPTDASLLALTTSLQACGFKVQRDPAASSWRTELTRSWDEFLAKLSRTRRWRARRIYRDYFASGRATVFLAHDDETYRRGFNLLVELHQQRRCSLGHTGRFASSSFRNFLWTAGRDLLDSDGLDLQWIELDGRPIAAQYDLLSRTSVYHYQSGFAPWAAEHRPGWHGMMMALSRACDSGAACFDFLRGHEPHKASWGAVEVPQENITLIPPRFQARARHAARASILRLRKPTGRLLRRCRMRL